MVTDTDGVSTHIRGPDGAESLLRAKYAIGCDGAHSTVRRLLGIGRENLGFEQRWLVIVRCGVDIDAWDGVHQVCDTRRAGTFMRIGPARYRWEFQLLDSESADDCGSIQALRKLIEPWLRGVPAGCLELLKVPRVQLPRPRRPPGWRAPTAAHR